MRFYGLFKRVHYVTKNCPFCGVHEEAYVEASRRGVQRREVKKDGCKPLVHGGPSTPSHIPFLLTTTKEQFQMNPTWFPSKQQRHIHPNNPNNSQITFPKAETPADSTMALVFTTQSLRNASRGVKKEKCSEVMHRSYSGVLIRAAASRNVPLHAASPMSGVQKRDFHFASLKAKYQNFVTRNSIYIAEINNTALKYGLFGVAVGRTLHAL